MYLHLRKETNLLCSITSLTKRKQLVIKQINLNPELQKIILSKQASMGKTLSKNYKRGSHLEMGPENKSVHKYFEQI